MEHGQGGATRLGPEKSSQHGVISTTIALTYASPTAP